jgi:hypothetical protein
MLPTEAGLFEPRHGGLDVQTPRTFEGPQIVSWLLWFNAHQIHLSRALWAIRTRVNGRVIKRVFGKRHFRSPVCRREYRNSQPPTPDRVAVGDVPQYDLFPCGPEQNGSL